MRSPVTPSRPRRPTRLLALAALVLSLLALTFRGGPVQAAGEADASAGGVPAIPSLLTPRSGFPAPASPGEEPDGEAPQDVWSFVQRGPQTWTSREGMSASLQVLLLLTVLSLAPAVVLMTTSFVRIIVVLGLLRQALGTQQLPPSQVITTLALFLTFLVMTPVWKRVYTEGVAPYTAGEIDLEQAWARGVLPVRQFMSRQIEAAGNSDDVWLFLEYADHAGPTPQTYDEVPLQALLPAFLISELKTAFLIGFQIYLPFLVLDLVVSSVTTAMGMMMLPPAMISLPFKIMLFVLADGWGLVVGMLLESFASG